MISTEEKIKKTKTTVKNLILISALYLVIFIAAILNALIIAPNQSVSVFGGAMIVLYSLTTMSIFVLIYNIIRHGNMNMIRKKAIRDYDERNAMVQEKTNSYTLQFILFSIMIGLLLSIYLNSVELFSAGLILLVLIIMAHVIIKFFVKKKL